jgi:beta-lactamase superfamily II metal-dependent hydrolase
MRLTVFQSDMGDCLLLRGADGKLLLADGGMSASYSKHVAPALGKLRDNGEKIDVVYVSHIDQDHISGVLRMMDDEFDWRRHDFQVKVNNKHQKAPQAPRPPAVKDIWHNTFHDQLDKNAGEIEEMLAASAAVLSGARLPVVRELAMEQSDLVTSMAEAIQLSQRVSPQQLGIRVNQPAKGKLMMVRDSSTVAIKLGGMRIRVIGPFFEDLKDLRIKWNKWLESTKGKLRVKKLRAQAAEDDESFTVREIADLMLPKLQEADELSSLLPLDSATTKFKLGARKKVTVENLASLMLFVEEAGKTLLLTGDGHRDEIIKGLTHIKKLKPGKGLHVDVLKVQHHASEYNIDEEFCRLVTADHYLFCGRKGGVHGNPDPRVIKAVADSRLSTDPAVRSANPQTGDKFKFWFNNSSAASETEDDIAHMKKIEKDVKALVTQSGGQMSSFFLKGSSYELEI